MQRREFRAMGTDVLLLLDAEDTAASRDALDAAVGEIRRIEALASRFDPESELSRLNRAGSGVASADLLQLLRRAQDLRQATGGRFDPTVHAAMIAAGYDRTFAEVAAEGEDFAGVPGGAPLAIDASSGWVELPGGVDLGGIAKGWTADRVADALGVQGPCLVSIGGDLAVRGMNAGRPWPIAVDHGAAGARTIGLHRGGMATSGTDRRCWRRGGAEVHHVIDPAMGRPATTDLRRVTVLAADAATAEAWATALLVAGRSEATCLARDHVLTAVLVGIDTVATVTGDLA